MTRTKDCCQSDKYLVSVISPRKTVSPETISSWFRQLLAEARIDTVKYSAHSSRAAVATKTAVKLDTAKVLASVGWKSSQTFERFLPQTQGVGNNIMARLR